MVESDNIVLGGNIELVGFKDLDGGSMVILKKMVGNHVRKMGEIAEKFEKLTVTMKNVGSSEHKFEIQAKLLDNGKQYTSEVTDFNLFFTLDKALTKILNELRHE
jgi:transcriptional/translational regulatory protein YebC/TACO1